MQNVDDYNLALTTANVNNVMLAGCDGICGTEFQLDSCGNCSGNCSDIDPLTNELYTDGLIRCSENAGIVKSFLNPFYTSFLDQCEQYSTDSPCSDIFETVINSEMILVVDECGVCGEDGPNEGYNCDGSLLSQHQNIIPDKYSILNIYPNPFNPVTNINYSMPKMSNINIIIYDMGGRKITTLYHGTQIQGYHSIIWDASEQTSGIYFLKMIAGDHIVTQKLMLIK